MSAHPILYQLSDTAKKSSAMWDFMAYVNTRHNLNLDSYPALHQWSVSHVSNFCRALWDHSNILHSKPPEVICDNPHTLPGATWFHGARLNFAQNLLRIHDHRPALIVCNEQGYKDTISYTDLHTQVAQLAHQFKAWGIQPGDRIAGIVCNAAWAVVGMLAATSLGAIWSSCSPDFGTGAIVDRLGQIQPRILLASSHYTYKGKPIMLTQGITDVCAAVSSIEHIVWRNDIDDTPVQQTASHHHAWADIATGSPKLDFVQLPFEHPVYIVFSSGTTGAPKCITHSAGGTLLQHIKELKLHTNLKANETLFFYTTCGWMMWNWGISALALGASVLTYDGCPTYPDTDHLFKLCARHRVAVFGTSARFLVSMEQAGVKPKNNHDLSALHSLLSTGSTLLPSSFDYVYRDIKNDVYLASISGGSDILSCFALGNPLSPVRRSELSGPGLGMAVDVYDEDGKSVRNQKGQLVCTQAFPCMPTGFWGDADGSKYKQAYFNIFPGAWAHGDFVTLYDHGGMVFYGRSDTVLNKHGVRIGTAEIYRQLSHFDDIKESLAVNFNQGNNEEVILFVEMKPQKELTHSLIDNIKAHIRQHCSARHVPDRIIAAPELPITHSGKVVELAVKHILHGTTPKHLGAIANPQALQYFYDLPQLQL